MEAVTEPTKRKFSMSCAKWSKKRLSFIEKTASRYLLQPPGGTLPQKCRASLDLSSQPTRPYWRSFGRCPSEEQADSERRVEQVDRAIDDAVYVPYGLTGTKGWLVEGTEMAGGRDLVL